MNNIAVITARGGSKRIPKKNIREFLGKPMISYSIKAALDSRLFNEIMVSTDSEEIAQIAEKLGARVPFLRSPENSDDYAPCADVIIEVIQRYEDLGVIFDYGCCLYPTAPFIEAADLRKAYKLMTDTDSDSAVSVVKFQYPPQRAYIIKNGSLRYLYPENYSKRSQDLEPEYHDSGQFYFFKPDCVKAEKKLTLKNNVPYIMNALRVQDIDNEEDWKLAELKYRILHETDWMKHNAT